MTYLKIIPEDVTYSGSQEVMQYVVEAIEVEEVHDDGTLKINIKLRRMFLHHLASTYLPTICLLVIAETTLYIDDSHFETTITVALTSMLVMYSLFQSISNSLPQTVYLKMIDIWLLFGLIIPFIVFLVEVLFELLAKVNGSCGKTKLFKKFIKWLIPIGTIVFITMYWSIAMFILHF